MAVTSRLLVGAAALPLLSGCAENGAATSQSPEGTAPPADQETEADGEPTAEAEATTPAADPTADEPDSSPTPSPTEEPERASEASSDPDSIHVLVNRQNPLEPLEYEPDDLVYPDVPFSGPEAAMRLREEASEALEELVAAGDAEDMHLGLVSGYRSFDYQVQIYASRHAEVGTEETDRYMSRPGYSEHQTGLAADVISIANPNCMLGECFADTPEGEWVAENAHEFGFLIRYLEDMEHITGYPYEPWHLRYVGEETAAEVYEEGVTLEEYWDEGRAPDYDREEPNPEYLHHSH